MWLERLPPYAPELNPVEGVWRYLKRVRLRDVCCRALSELRYELRLATANLRHKAQVRVSLPKLCGLHSLALDAVVNNDEALLKTRTGTR